MPIGQGVNDTSVPIDRKDSSLRSEDIGNCGTDVVDAEAIMQIKCGC